ncbi:hypothetical protein D3C81_2005820 [compost metagenome]
MLSLPCHCCHGESVKRSIVSQVFGNIDCHSARVLGAVLACSACGSLLRQAVLRSSAPISSFQRLGCDSVAFSTRAISQSSTR